MPNDPRLKGLVSDEKYDSCVAKVMAQLKKKGHPDPKAAAHAICTSTFQKQYNLPKMGQGEGLTFSRALAHLLLSEALDDPRTVQQEVAQIFKAQIGASRDKQGRPESGDVRPVIAALETKLRQSVTAEEESDWGSWWTAQVDEAQKTASGDQVQWALLTTGRSLATRELSSTSLIEAARALLGRLRSMTGSSSTARPALKQIANRNAQSG